MTPTLNPVTTKPLNAETPLVALAHATTPTALFYVRNHFSVPALDAETWRLSVGLLNGPAMELSLDDLQVLPAKTLTVTLACAGIRRKLMEPSAPGTQWGNGPVATATFTGTSLRHVLAYAGFNIDDRSADILDDEAEVLFVGADEGKIEMGETVSYARSLSLEKAAMDDVLVAWAMNDEPLSADHGFPARLVVPGWYGMASVKWLSKIHVTPQPFDGFFQTQHYVYWEDERLGDGVPVTEMLVQSLISMPGDGDVLAVGQGTAVTGTAWSGAGDIATVEVKIDGPDGEGAWQPAVVESAADYAARTWRLAWQPDLAGPHRIYARATDSEGHTQPIDKGSNRLGYANNSVHCVTVSVE